MVNLRACSGVTCAHPVLPSPNHRWLVSRAPQLRSRPRGKSLEDIDAPLDLPSTKHWKTQGAAGALPRLRYL